jgi:hypothetical protein
VLTIGDATALVDKAIALINRFASIDDVYSQSFARTVVLQSILGRNGDGHLAQFKASGRFSAVYHIASISPTKALPPGPYFLSQGNVCRAYRLYEDELDSFIFSVIPDDVLSPKKFEDPRCSGVHLKLILTTLGTPLSLRSVIAASGRILPFQVVFTLSQPPKSLLQARELD